MLVIKLQVSRLLLKGDSNTGAFLWNLRNFQERLFWRKSAKDCFCVSNMPMQIVYLKLWAFKVARMVNSKLTFTDWFFKFDNTNQVMQMPIPKLRQTSVISEKSGYLSEKLKTSRSSNYHKVKYFLLKFYMLFLLNHVYKRVFGISQILFRSCVINKNVKSKCVETRYFSFWQVTQDLKKIKNFPNTLV